MHFERHYFFRQCGIIFGQNWRYLRFKSSDTPSEFDLYDIRMIFAKFQISVLIWTSFIFRS